MKAIDEYDIRASFEVLDTGLNGFISIDDFQTLYLGLSFQDPVRMTIEQLRTEVMQQQTNKETSGENAAPASPANQVSLDTVLKVLSQHTRDRSKYIESSFQLVDRDGKGYITATDVQRLASDISSLTNPRKRRHSSASPKSQLSIRQAKRMVSFCSYDGRVDVDDFRRLLSPPEP